MTSEPVQTEPVQTVSVQAEPGWGERQQFAPADWSEPVETVDLPDPAQTGDSGVDEAMLRLASVTGATLDEQLPVLESVHRTLQDRLADVDG